MLRVSVPTGTINWSDGSPFNGYLLIGVVLPVSGGQDWPGISTESQYPTRIPIWFPIPIRRGKFGSTTGVLYNDDINPPNTQYVAYYYDNRYKKVAGPSAKFTVNAPTFTPPILTLTVPSPGSSDPSPDG